MTILSLPLLWRKPKSIKDYQIITFIKLRAFKTRMWLTFLGNLDLESFKKAYYEINGETAFCWT